MNEKARENSGLNSGWIYRTAISCLHPCIPPMHEEAGP